MKVLQLIIKQKHLDEILSGNKTQEFREIRPNTVNKYCEVDKDGYVKEINGVIMPRQYDVIKFCVGYSKNRKTALVEVLSADVELFVDENNDFITYVENNNEYIASQIIYSLGKVL